MRLDMFEKVFNKFKDQLDPNGAAFCQRVFQQDEQIYTDRLKALGFEGQSKVLDAGCGFGQWSIPLAKINEHVTAVDVDGSRLMFLDELVRSSGLNAEIKWASLSDLPFENDSFTAIFSYSVIFLGDWQKNLAELARTLRPGGQLYFNFNEIGWYLNLWQNRPNAAKNYDPRSNAAKAFHDTWQYNEYGAVGSQTQIIISEEECRNELERLNFENIQFASDGGISLDPSIKPKQFFPETHDGIRGVREVLSTKAK